MNILEGWRCSFAPATASPFRLAKPKHRRCGGWYTYGLDLTKNVCEVFGTTGYISTAYTYTPYGSVTATGSTTQPIQWSSEFYDAELSLVYYNYRHYNPVDGRWGSRDFIHANNLYNFCNNDSILSSDYIGLWQNVNGGTLYKAGSKDTLFGLAKKITGSGNDWPCLWPYEKAATPNSMEHRYPNVCPGDIYDASNLVNTTPNNVTLVIEYDFSDVAHHYDSNYERVHASDLFTVIRKYAKEGATPISNLAVFGHSSPNGILGGKAFFWGWNEETNINDLAKLNFQPTYDRARRKKGPIRCWFKKDTIARFAACYSNFFAISFAKIALRKTASAIGAVQAIGFTITNGQLHFGYGVKLDPKTKKNKIATKIRNTTWNQIWENKVWNKNEGGLS